MCACGRAAMPYPRARAAPHPGCRPRAPTAAARGSGAAARGSPTLGARPPRSGATARRQSRRAWPPGPACAAATGAGAGAASRSGPAAAAPRGPRLRCVRARVSRGVPRQRLAGLRTQAGWFACEAVSASMGLTRACAPRTVGQRREQALERKVAAAALEPGICCLGPLCIQCLDLGGVLREVKGSGGVRGAASNESLVLGVLGLRGSSRGCACCEAAQELAPAPNPAPTPRARALCMSLSAMARGNCSRLSVSGTQRCAHGSGGGSCMRSCGPS